MQDKNSKTNTASDPIAAANAMAGKATQSDFVRKIVEKIKSSENILIALSCDPSVDELAAAIGLAMYLDGMQKHTTAIYSGRTPENLAFLQPDATFERNTDSLQDFIISLNKDKADHLRYKLDGDFVKIFITPYKTTLSEDDLSFSHGDYNVDFVIAINVPSAGNLDEALREHGRIMHDASVVNITTGEPGRFGEIEWSNITASSLCEMITELIFALQGNDELPLDKDIATALLTGIVAATDRFSNERTNPDTMGVASKLMAMGADQQLITANVQGNEIIHNDNPGIIDQATKAPRDRTNLAVDHGPEPAVASSSTTSVNNPAANPAVQAAPNPNLASSPTPPTVVTATNNVTPESVVVQPVIPGAPVPVPNAAPAPAQPSTPAPAQFSIPIPAPTLSSPTAPADPSMMRLPNMAPSAPTNATPAAPVTMPPVSTASVANNAADPNAPRPMATSAPAAPTSRQVGSTIQPPAPKPKRTKNYAEMMEEALAEPIGNNAVNNMQPAAPATDLSMLNLPVQPASPAPAAAPAPVATPQPAAPAMEPVANPLGGAVLPPPPAPTMGNDMMPPVLPQVQMPPEGQ